MRTIYLDLFRIYLKVEDLYNNAAAAYVYSFQIFLIVKLRWSQGWFKCLVYVQRLLNLNIVI